MYCDRCSRYSIIQGTATLTLSLAGLDRHAPWVVNLARLDVTQVFPERTRDRTHAIRTRGEMKVLPKVANLVDRANDSRGARAEELDEVAFQRSLLDFAHRDLTLRDDEFVSQLRDVGLALRVLLGKREHRIARNTREDDAVERGRNELRDCGSGQREAGTLGQSGDLPPSERLNATNAFMVPTSVM